MNPKLHAEYRELLDEFVLLGAAGMSIRPDHLNALSRRLKSLAQRLASDGSASAASKSADMSATRPSRIRHPKPVDGRVSRNRASQTKDADVPIEEWYAPHRW